MLPTSDTSTGIENQKLASVVTDEITNPDTETEHYITIRVDDQENAQDWDYRWTTQTIGMHHGDLFVATRSDTVEAVTIYDVTELQSVLNTIGYHVTAHDLNTEIHAHDRFQRMQEHDDITLPDALT